MPPPVSKDDREDTAFANRSVARIRPRVAKKPRENAARREKATRGPGPRRGKTARGLGVLKKNNTAFLGDKPCVESAYQK